MAYHYADLVHAQVFTPKEPQVELLEASRERNLCVLGGPGKSFICCKIIEHMVNLHNGEKVIYIANSIPAAVHLSGTLRRLTSCIVADAITEELDVVLPDDYQVLVTTTGHRILKEQVVPISKICLIIINGCDAAFMIKDFRQLIKFYTHVKNPPKLLGLAGSILDSMAFPWELEAQMGGLEKFFNCEVDTTSEIVTVLKSGLRPSEYLLLYKTREPMKEIELEIRNIISSLRAFLMDHRYDPAEIYGIFAEDMANLPPPSAKPLLLLQQFEDILDNLGPWAADKAALALIIRLEDLKIKTPFERYYLLLVVIETALIKIRAIFDFYFEKVPEKYRVLKYTSPKCLRLIEVVEQFRQFSTSLSSEEGRSNDVCRCSSIINFISNHVDNPSLTFEECIRQEKLKNKAKSGKRKPSENHPRPPDGPHALCALILVKDDLYVRVIFDLLSDLRKYNNNFKYLRPCYTIQPADDFDDHQEAYRVQEIVLKNFRMRECNILIGTEILESGIDLPKCNLVVRFDLPSNFRSYEFGKCRARGSDSLHCIFVPEIIREDSVQALSRHHETENMLLRRSGGFEKWDNVAELEADNYTSLLKPFCPQLTPEAPQVNLSSAVTLVNKYCAKLPSDTFTRLTPFCIDEVLNVANKQLFISKIRLPINSPLKEEIVGPAMPTRILARRFAALQCCLKLHAARELDDNLLPITKESFWIREEEQLGIVMNIPEDLTLKTCGEIRPGTTKRRQFYNKRIATALTNCRPQPGVPCYLYCIRMVLTCPLPEEQNTRGRRIRNPEDSLRGFGILTKKPIPNVGAFPIFTRAGEVEISLQLASEFVVLKEEDIEKIIHFLNYTFTSVLRLQKFLMMFDPEASENAYFVVPIIKDLRSSTEAPKSSLVDWEFLDLIFMETLKGTTVEPPHHAYHFEPSKYADAVVSPWYRNQDQPQYFYVAEVCEHLNPKSAFPGNEYATFEAYYMSKYELQIEDVGQSLLDVDHTSARLNFLTPRYVNRKGVALPTTSDEKKKARRENLAQKQILVPELCNVHPFPASLWQKAVCLPCILHRLNSLLLADEVRRMVAGDLNLGDPSDTAVEWGPLDFGWKLADVLAKSKDAAKTDKATVSSTNPSLESVKASDMVVSLNHNELETPADEDDEADTVPELEDETLETDNAWPVPTMWDPQACDIPVDMMYEYGQNSDTSFESETNSVDLSEDTKSDDGLKIQFMEKDVAEAVDENIIVDSRFGEEIDEKWVGSFDVEDISTNLKFLRKYNDPSVLKEIEEKLVVPSGVPFTLPWSPDKDVYSTVSSEGTDKLSSRNKAPELIDDFDDESNDLEHAEFVKQSLAKFETNLDIKSGVTQVENNAGTSDVSLCSEGEDLNVFSLNRQPKLEGHPGPSPSLILQALTMSNANDGINLERLETIGDSFLKYAITTYLYCSYEKVHEGKLSHLRSKQVSNLNLYRLGKLKDFAESMVATKFEPHDNWLPPCYFVPRDLERALIELGIPPGSWNRADLPAVYRLGREEVNKLVREFAEQNGLLGGQIKNELSDADGFIPYNLMTQQSIPDKSVADCVEALIGAYLVACGPRGALLFMSWLGIKVLPKEEIFAPTAEELLINRGVGHTAPKPTEKNGCHGYVQVRYGKLSKPSSPLLRNVPDPEGELGRLMNGFEKLEEILKYTFKDKSYLLQALTHASFSTNRLTDCYQRLEFLGDAVLDYLITRHLYEDPRHHSPGALTDLRSALVNNTIFASLAVRYDYHKYFRHFCPALHEVLDRFVRIQEERGHVIPNECYMVEEGECEIVEDVEVPKALGDIFESVAGAIFLDSGMRLDAVWNVYYSLMKTEIDAFSTKVPKSPIRELLELEPETAQFGKPEKLADGRRVRVAVDVFGKGTFKGIGRNYRIAKCTAAKCALKQLKKRGLLEKKK